MTPERVQTIHNTLDYILQETPDNIPLQLEAIRVIPLLDSTEERLYCAYLLGKQ